MKIGIIGLGSIGTRHYNNLQKFKANIVVLTKRSELCNMNTVLTWDDFVAAGPYDGIFITNETSKHFQTIEKCIKIKPKALFIEKPLSHNANGLKDLLLRLKEANISTWVGYNLHFFKPLVRAKDVIKRNYLGRVYYIRAAIGQDLATWRPRDYKKCYSSKKDGGGGVMLDLVHDINYPAWLLDEKLFAKTCVMKKISDLDIDTEDCVESILLSESGVIVSVHQDYVRVPYRKSLEIAGDKGSFNWNSDSSRIVVKNSENEIVLSEDIKTDRSEMFEQEIEFFINSIKKGEYFSNIEEAINDVVNIDNLKKYATK